MHAMSRKLYIYISQYPMTVQARHGYVDALASRDHQSVRRIQMGGRNDGGQEGILDIRTLE